MKTDPTTNRHAPFLPTIAALTGLLGFVSNPVLSQQVIVAPNGDETVLPGTEVQTPLPRLL